MGPQIVEDRGLEPTGRRVADIFPAHLVDTALAPYLLSYQHACPVFEDLGWPTRRPAMTPDETLFLPLANNGRQVDMIMVYTVRRSRQQRTGS